MYIYVCIYVYICIYIYIYLYIHSHIYLPPLTPTHTQDGVGVAIDENKAVETYLAAANTHDTAQLQLGIAYQYGIGVRRNPEEAVTWYTRAAGAGNVESMMNLAFCYADGVCVCVCVCVCV